MMAVHTHTLTHMHRFVVFFSIPADIGSKVRIFLKHLFHLCCFGTIIKPIREPFRR